MPSLTRREQDILQLISEELTNAEIATIDQNSGNLIRNLKLY